jgi:hypothetical protein
VTAVLFLAAARDLLPRFGLRLVNEPGLLIRVGPDEAGFLRWAYLADMLSYYLLLVPVILAVRRERPGPAADVGAVGGLAYVVAGGSGAALLATISPPLIEAFAQADPAVRDTAQTTFTALTEGIQHGVWQSFDAIAVGVWALVAGASLRRAAGGLVGGLGLIIGALGLTGGASRMLGFDTGVLVLFAPLGGLIPVWMVLVGLWLLRDRT